MRAVVIAAGLWSSVAAAEPSSYRAKPLATGQWVMYRERVGGQDVGTVSMTVGNRASAPAAAPAAAKMPAVVRAFAPTLIDPTSLFVQLTAGYARLENMGSVGNGGGASAAVGWQAQIMRDWAETVQVFDDVAYDNGNVGFRNTVGVSVALELWIQ